MREERLRILKMVEDGKISVDEATKLLEALRESYPFEFYADESDFNDKVKEFSKDAESFLKNVCGKMGEIVKEMEPKVKNVTKTVVTKTAVIVEELGKALGECLNNLGGEPCCKDDDCCKKPDEENREN